jgi:hypothetical protein
VSRTATLAAVLAGLVVAVSGLLLWDEFGSDDKTFEVGDVRHLAAAPGALPEAWLDNRTILVSGRSRLELVRTDRERSIPVAHVAGPPTWVEVSPDRRWIAYAEHGESARLGKLAVAAIKGPGARVLLSGSEIYELRWTRDGGAVAFQRELPLSPDAFWIVSREGGRPTLLRDSAYDRDDLVRFPVRRLTQPVNTRIGSWKVWSPPKLIRERRTTDERCAAPVVSPNGRLVACSHERQTLADQMNERVGEVDLAIIRIS